MGWLYVLAYKFVLGVAVVYAYYWLILVPLRRLRQRLPNNRLVNALFRERGYGASRKAAGLRENVLDDPPLIGRE